MPSRRAVLAAATLPLLGRAALADDPPPPANTPPATTPPANTPAATTPPATIPPPTTPPASPPVPPLATTPPMPQPGAPVPPRPPAAPTATPAIDRTKAYYVYFDQNLDVNSLRTLRRQCTALAEAGVGDITIVLHSTGGLIDATLTTYSYLRALPCTINTHALGFVASAANVLFMVGEKRTANRNCRFMFHPTTAPMSGSMSSGQMRDRVVQFEAMAASINEIYRDRTNFTEDELARFAREEVIYTAAQARAGGLVQEVADLRIPDPNRARVVFLD